MASREVEKRRRQEKHKLNRRTPHLKVPPTILIVCEGENTEPSYFNALKFKSATIRAVGEGYNTISLVNRAVQLAEEKSYGEVWCVFDKDNFADSDFNQAITSAKSHDFHIAYSNQSFEYWIILHFNDHQGCALHRDRYNEVINQAIHPFGAFYDGKGCKKVTPELFHLMFSKDRITNKERVQLAIERAERIYSQLDHSSPAKEESSTTVHVLLKHLLEFQRY
ncbi:MAG: RloB family protein [Sphaerochaeta sp.]